MNRFLMNDLIKWKNKHDRKPLLIMGARQVGKTWLMKEFGKTNYSSVAYISFYNNNRLKNIFDGDVDISRIISSLNIEVGFEINKDTLIIFDEIQEVPRAIESLKYFYENYPEYHVIAAGSLLGVTIHNGISFPVGKCEILNLYPLNFREFLCANGKQQLSDALTSKNYVLIDSFKDEYIYWLKNYYYVGGMPEIVKYFVEHKDYSEIRNKQNELIYQYRADFGKHIKGKDLPLVNIVWDSIPIQLAKENKKFFFSVAKKGSRSKDFEVAVQWLCDSGLVYRLDKINEPKIPLSSYKELSSYKLFFLDVGILGAMSGVDASSIIDGNTLFVEYKGAMCEQYVYQQLLSDSEYKPYYYGTNTSNFEQDFIVQKGNYIVPIEVKSGQNVRSQSLKCFYEKFKPEYCVRFSLNTYIDQGWVKNIPLYAVCNL